MNFFCSLENLKVLYNMRSDRYCDYSRCKNYKQNNKQLCFIHEKQTKQKMYSSSLKQTGAVSTRRIIFLLLVFMMCLFVYFESEAYVLFEKLVLKMNVFLTEHKSIIDNMKIVYRDTYTLVENLYTKCVTTFPKIVVELAKIQYKSTIIILYNEFMKVYGMLYIKPQYMYAFATGYVVGSNVDLSD